MTTQIAPDTQRPRLRRAVLVMAILRYVIPVVAIPFAPLLVPDRVALLVLVRPSKEVLLLGGGLYRTTGEPGPALMFAAYVPLMILAVWVFFLLGRLYRDALVAGHGPKWLLRIVPEDTFALGRRVLDRRGPTIAVLGRVAALPPTVLAAAAGTSDVSARRYLIADAIGAVLSFGILVGIGIALGQAYEQGGPWLTGAGLVLVVALVLLLTRWIQREGERDDARIDPAHP